MFVQVKDETTKFKWSQPRVRVTAPVPHMHTNIPFFCVLVFRLYSEADSVPTELLILPPLIMQLCSDDCSLKQSVWTNSASFPSCSSAKPQSRRSRCAPPPSCNSFFSFPSQPRTRSDPAEDKSCSRRPRSAKNRCETSIFQSSSSDRPSCLHMERTPD